MLRYYIGKYEDKGGILMEKGFILKTLILITLSFVAIGYI